MSPALAGETTPLGRFNDHPERQRLGRLGRVWTHSDGIGVEVVVQQDPRGAWFAGVVGPAGHGPDLRAPHSSGQSDTESVKSWFSRTAPPTSVACRKYVHRLRRPDARRPRCRRRPDNSGMAFLLRLAGHASGSPHPANDFRHVTLGAPTRRDRARPGRPRLRAPGGDGGRCGTTDRTQHNAPGNTPALPPLGTPLSAWSIGT